MFGVVRGSVEVVEVVRIVDAIGVGVSTRYGFLAHHKKSVVGV